MKRFKRTTVSFQHALDIDRYQLSGLSTKYTISIFWSISKQVDKVKMILGPKTFNLSVPITILSFVADLLTVFTNTAIHKT